jgi:UDP-glucose 4-epimerase
MNEPTQKQLDALQRLSDFTQEVEQMKPILITGSSGYIGQHLVKHLKKCGYEVYGIDINNRLNDYLLPKEFLTSNLCYDLKSWVFRLNGWPDEFDTVVHLGALVRVNESVEEPTKYYNTNINGMIKILDEIKCNNFIFASTGAAENPVSPYALSKRCGEDIVREYRKDKDYTIFRFYNVIGSDGVPPTNPDGLFYNLLEASKSGRFNIYGNDYNTPDGTAIRDYVHVMDICNSIRMAIEKPANGLENLGTGIGYSVLEIAKTFCEVNKVDIKIEYLPRRSGDVERTVLDNVSNYMIQSYTLEQLLRK